MGRSADFANYLIVFQEHIACPDKGNDGDEFFKRFRCCAVQEIDADHGADDNPRQCVKCHAQIDMAGFEKDITACDGYAVRAGNIMGHSHMWRDPHCNQEGLQYEAGATNDRPVCFC